MTHRSSLSTDINVRYEGHKDFSVGYNLLIE